MLKGPTQRQVAHGVVDHIVGQAMAPGSNINEQALARHLGVSRTPVRAVLRHLAGKGILEHRLGSGFFLARRVQTADDVEIDADGSAADLHARFLMDILFGTLVGTWSQSALMRRYKVSRGELTASLRRMTREALCEPAPGQGWTFIRFDATVIQEGYHLRMILEPALLADDSYQPDEAALRALQHDHATLLRSLSAKSSWNELFSLDARFHETLAAGSGNRQAVEVIGKQNRIRRICEYLGYERLDRVRGSLGEHCAVLESLLDDDRQWAAAQLRRHLQVSLNQSLRHFARDLGDFRSGKRHFRHSGPLA